MKQLSLVIFLVLTTYTVTAQNSETFLSVYDRYWEVDDGYYRVSLSGKVGLVDSKGNVIVPCENDQVWNLKDNGNVKVLKNGKLGIYNLDGVQVIPPVYDMIWAFSEGRARVMMNGKIGYVNELGLEYIPCKYDQIWQFEKGRAKVIRNGKIGYVNESGTEFIIAKYDKIWDFEEGSALVLKNGSMGMINESGNEYILAKYQKIWEFEHGRAKVLMGGKMGFINESGYEIIPCEYQQIGEFEDGVARAIKNGKVIYINVNGIPVDASLYPNILTPDIPRVAEVSDVTIVSNIDSASDMDTTELHVLGASMKIINEDNSTKVSFDNNYADKSWRKSKNSAFKGHFSGVDLGFNSYLTSDGDLSLPEEYDYLSLNSGKSLEFSINALQQDIQLSSNCGFVTGLGLTYNNYRFDNTITLENDDVGNLSYSEIDGDVEKTKLTAVYLTFPVLFELQFSKRKSDAFYLSAGVIGAYRLSSHTKVVTKEDGKKTKDKDNGSFTLNDFKYGAQLRLGFKSINIYGTYYLSPLFDDKKAPELYPISIGFSFLLDWF